jgi:HPt (histidine-containing phosphotransfer) domain-containing protein
MTSEPSRSEPLYSELSHDAELQLLVAMFVDELPQRIAAIQECQRLGLWDELRRLAHQLKGVGGTYGFDALTPSAARLEQCAARGEPEDEIRQALTALADLCRCVRADPPP